MTNFVPLNVAQFWADWDSIGSRGQLSLKLLMLLAAEESKFSETDCSGRRPCLWKRRRCCRRRWQGGDEKVPPI